MLSPGRHHRRVPKGVRENLRYRRHVLAAADRDPAYRAAIWQACKEDMLFYVNTFVWQFNPKASGKELGPFVTWEFQDQAFTSRDPHNPGILWCVDNDEDCVIEKSRDMGASWMCLLAFEWMWHFHEWKKFLVISRNEDAVDNSADPDSLFWKIDHVHKHLPAWLMPQGWDQKKHRTHLLFENPQTKSVIAGQASTGKAGVGGRATAMFIDEFSQIREDTEVKHRTADTTNCRVFNGTHVGVGTEFFKMTQRPGVKKIVMHWHRHPVKGAGLYHYDPEKAQVVPHDPAYKYDPDFVFDTSGKPAGGPHPGLRSPWYDRECVRRGSERDVAMDLDIDPRGSVSQFFDALTINQLKASYCSDPFWRGELHYDRDTAQPDALIPVADGALKLWLVPTVRGKVPVGKYGAGADIAQGTGATPSCLTIIRATGESAGLKVLEYTNPFMKPEEFAMICVAFCRLFRDEDGNGALFAWEAAGPGLQFGKTVLDAGYRNVYYRLDDFDPDADQSSKPGWYPSPASKLSLLSEYRAALVQRRVENRSAQSLDETLLFKYGDRGEIVHSEEASKGDPSGAKVNHADRVIADALAWKMADRLGGGMRAKKEAPKEPEVLSLQWRRELLKRRDAKKRAWI